MVKLAGFELDIDKTFKRRMKPVGFNEVVEDYTAFSEKIGLLGCFGCLVCIFSELSIDPPSF